MTVTTHAAIGTVIGFHVGNPILGFILGFLVHFVCDMIPHGDSKLADDFKTRKSMKAPITYGTLDFFFTVVVMLTAFNIKGDVETLPLFAAIVGSVLPDAMIGVYEFSKKRLFKRFHDLHFYYHNMVSYHTGDFKLRYAILGQAIVVLFIFHWLS